MAGNTVSILIGARDEAAPDLDDLKARLDELSAKVATARADVDDADGAAKLDRMQAKLIDLGTKVARPKITMSGAIRAEADIHAVEASLDDLNKKEDEAVAKAGAEGLLSKIMTGSEGGGAGGGEGILSSLMGPQLLAIVPAIAAALPEIVALASGFAAAGAGAVAFGALAYPAFEQVQGAMGDTKAQLDKLSPDEQGAVTGIRQLVTEFGKMSTAFEPEVFKVFTAGLQLVDRLLPDIVPFAKTFADVMSGLLNTVDNAMFSRSFEDVARSVHGITGSIAQIGPSNGFQEFLDQLHSIEGPALEAIGQGIGKVATAIGNLLTQFSGKDVAHAINIAFDGVAGVINGVTLAVDLLKLGWDKLSQDPTFKTIAGDIKTAWADISTTGKKQPDFSGLTTAVKNAVSTAVGWLSTKLTPLVDAALKTASTWLKNNVYPLMVPVGKALMQGLIAGIESNIPSLLPVLGNVAEFIAEHKGPLDADRLLLVPHGRAIMQGLMTGMNLELPVLRSQLAGISQADQRAGWGPRAARVRRSARRGQRPDGHPDRAGAGGSGLDSMFMSCAGELRALRRRRPEHLDPQSAVPRARDGTG